MPRGQPKKGQYEFKIWLPVTGGSLSVGSTKELSTAEWIDSVRKGLEIIERAVKTTAESSKKKKEEGG